MLLYHGTTEQNSKNILINGLTLNNSKFGSREIHASDNKQLALRWATQRTKELLDWEPEKCLPEVPVALFIVDGSYFQKSSDQIYIAVESIPASALKGLEIYRLGDLPKFPLSSTEWTNPLPVKVIKLNETKQLFSFITESKAFRNEEDGQKFSTKELGEICFAMLVSLHLLHESGFGSEVNSYAANTCKYPKFDRVYLSGTDLGNNIALLRNAKELLNQRNVDVPINFVKQYLHNFKSNNMVPQLKKAFFGQLQARLKITDGSLISVSNSIIEDAGLLNDSERLVLGEKLYQILRRYEYKCDVLALLQKLLDGDKHEN